MASFYPPPPPPPPPQPPAPPPAGRGGGLGYPARGGRGARHNGRGGHGSSSQSRYPPPLPYGPALGYPPLPHQPQQYLPPAGSGNAYPGWSQPGNHTAPFQHHVPAPLPHIPPTAPPPTSQQYAYAHVPAPPPPPFPQQPWAGPHAQPFVPPPPMPGPERHNYHDRPPARGHYGHRHPRGAPSHFPGQKRKREHSPSGAAGHHGQPGSSGRGGGARSGNQTHDRRPRVAAPPAVPSYGFAGLPPKPPPPASAAAAAAASGPDKHSKKRGKKRKTNQLGLTPKADVHESSDEENDEDEEAAFAKLGNPINVAYKGKNYALASKGDVDVWIAERRKRFPTQKKIAEKRAAEEKILQQREARKKAGAGAKSDKGVSGAKDKRFGGRDRSPTRQQELKRKQLAELLRQADKLQIELERAEKGGQPKSSARNARANGREREANGALSEDEGNASDDEPETQSSKQQQNAGQLKAKKSATSGRMNTNIPCKYYLRDGHCRRKDCRFLHHLPENIARKSIYEKLSEQEFRSVGAKALQVIKELGDIGFLDPEPSE